MVPNDIGHRSTADAVLAVDGSSVVIGGRFTEQSADIGSFVTKISTDGAIEWRHDVDIDRRVRLPVILPVDTSRYLIAGYVGSESMADPLVLHVDDTGTVSSRERTEYAKSRTIHAGTRTADGRFLFGGSTTVDSLTRSGVYPWLLKTGGDVPLTSKTEWMPYAVGGGISAVAAGVALYLKTGRSQSDST